MKKLIMILIAFATLQATAQDQKREMKKQRMETAKNYSPEEMAELQTKRMTLKLNLNDKQQKEVSALFLEEAKFRQSKREAFSQSKMKEEKKNWSKEDRLKMTNARMEHQLEMKKNMESILSTEQFEKWNKTNEKRNEHYKKRSMSDKKTK